jgi:hypothetical protein
MLLTILLLPPKNERQWSVNDFGHFNFENAEGSTAFLTHNRTIARHSRQNMVVTTSGPCSKHERQLSINDFWPSMMENASAAWRHSTIIELSAPFLLENVSNNITTMS